MNFGGQGPDFGPFKGQGFPGQSPGGQFGFPGQNPGGQFGPPGQIPGGPYGLSGSPPAGQFGSPGPLPGGQFGLPGAAPGGSIRNTLGSGLKSRGVFQKDGKVTNSRGGFIGPKQFGAGYAQQGDAGNMPGGGAGFPAGMGSDFAGAAGGEKMGKGPFSFLSSGGPAPGGYGQPRQLILQPAREGIIGNGIATISPDNSFFLLANLPPPHTFLGQGQGNASYAAYLVDKKGRNGFLAGILRPVGNGVYQAQFRSTVPLSPYERVVVSAENPQYLAQAPNGPIVLQVKEGMGPSAFLKPAKNAGSSIWKKISGLFRKQPSVPPAPVPEVPLAPAGESVPGPSKS